MIIPVKTKINPAAFSGDLLCPYPSTGRSSCGSKKWAFVESVTPTRVRYRCKVCNRTIQYDFANNPMAAHPYEPFKKSVWQRIVQNSKRALKGNPVRA